MVYAISLPSKPATEWRAAVGEGEGKDTGGEVVVVVENQKSSGQQQQALQV